MKERGNTSLAEKLQTPARRIFWTEWRGRSITYVSVWIVILILLSLLWFITSKGLQPFLNGEITLSQFFSTNWSPQDNKFGSLYIMLGSFMVTIGATLISAPLGISAAIFMTEIAPKWGKKVLQPATEILVGIPSVVYGFIGLTLLVPFIGKLIGGIGFGLLSGILVLSIMILPTIISISVDAIEAVPQKYREGSYALGATRWQTIWKIVLKTALPGLMTAVVLGMARAFGEALAVQMVIGNVPNAPFHFFISIHTLTSMITQNMGNTVPGETFNQILWSMALVLLLMTLVFILVIRLITRRRDVS
ncbi:phosphate ABC transporter permease subunit PstC [Shimazuella sp. AN120528]|uniref:phosphate ABC transporter permease subunit PstC n=1 Tax=Shimazuella soli TaxID=1892854 RepID=UPI001F0FC75A|nr:phosphate ABC transporter permease subunit PstC [Shimazuella soli]MCH5584374.1 phosphate ABC transporter permease subunit PstC [Shimazuella soli]